MLLSYQLIQDRPQHESYEGKRLYFYEKGETIPLIASGLWQVDRGIVQLNKLDGQEEIVLGWATPETSFGLWLNDVPTFQAQALCDVYLRWFSQQEIQTDPHLARIFLTQQSRRLLQTEELISVVGIRKVEDRLWQLLLLLKQEMGIIVQEGTRLTVRLTHQNLANAICTTRVTVTRLLGNFVERGLISIDRDRHIVIRHH